MDLTLPPDLSSFVAEKVASGAFATPYEVALEALRIYRDVERQHADLRREVQEAIAQVARGEVVVLENESARREFSDDIKRRGEARLASKREPPCSD